jgi:hypothetical protein
VESENEVKAGVGVDDRVEDGIDDRVEDGIVIGVGVNVGGGEIFLLLDGSEICTGAGVCASWGVHIGFSKLGCPSWGVQVCAFKFVRSSLCFQVGAFCEFLVSILDGVSLPTTSR